MSDGLDPNYIVPGNCCWYSQAFAGSRLGVISKVNKRAQTFTLILLVSGEVLDSVPFVRPNPSSWGSCRPASTEDAARHLLESREKLSQEVESHQKALTSSKQELKRLMSTAKHMPPAVAREMRRLRKVA